MLSDDVRAFLLFFLISRSSRPDVTPPSINTSRGIVSVCVDYCAAYSIVGICFPPDFHQFTWWPGASCASRRYVPCVNSPSRQSGPRWTYIGHYKWRPESCNLTQSPGQSPGVRSLICSRSQEHLNVKGEREKHYTSTLNSILYLLYARPSLYLRSRSNQFSLRVVWNCATRRVGRPYSRGNRLRIHAVLSFFSPPDSDVNISQNTPSFCSLSLYCVVIAITNRFA